MPSASPGRPRPREARGPRGACRRLEASAAAVEGGAGGEHAHQRAEAEEKPAVEPEQEPRSEPSDGRRAESSSPPPHEQVDDPEYERHDGDDEREANGPATRGAVVEEETVRGRNAAPTLASIGLRALPWPARARPPRLPRVRRRCRRADLRGDRDGGQAAVEQALLLGGVGNAELHELRDHRGRCRTSPRLLSTLAATVRTGCARRRHGPVAGDRDERAPEPVEAVEDDRRDRGVRVGEVCAKCLARHRRGRRRPSTLGRACARKRSRGRFLRSEATCELDERRRGGGVLADRSADAGVVSMGDENDRFLRAPRDHRDDVAQLDAPEVGKVLGPVRPPRCGGRGRRLSLGTSAALSAPTVPGTRSGFSVVNLAARSTAARSSKSGSRAPGREDA